MKYFVVVETPTSGDYWLKSEKPEFTRNYNDKMLMTEQDAKQFQVEKNGILQALRHSLEHL